MCPLLRQTCAGSNVMLCCELTQGSRLNDNISSFLGSPRVWLLSPQILPLGEDHLIQRNPFKTRYFAENPQPSAPDRLSMFRRLKPDYTAYVWNLEYDLRGIVHISIFAKVCLFVCAHVFVQIFFGESMLSVFHAKVCCFETINDPD